MLKRDLIKNGYALFAEMAHGEGLDYVDDSLMAPQALLELLTNLQHETVSIDHFCLIHELKQFLNENRYRYVSNLSEQWEVASEQLLILSDSILARPDWVSRVETLCLDPFSPSFPSARHAAALLGIDTWEQSFERVQSGEADWFFLKTMDENRIARLEWHVAELLTKKDLRAETLDLDMVFFCLLSWPEYKKRLILAALKSSVAEFRYMGLTQLREGPRTLLSDDLIALLSSMMQNETDIATKIFAGNVLNYHTQNSAETN